MSVRSRTVALVILVVGTVVPTQPLRASSTCTDSGGRACGVGGRGPGGGTIFFDAGAPTWWGRWLEARPLRTDGVPWSLNPTSSIFGADPDLRTVVEHAGIGFGAENTSLIVAQNGPGRYAAAIVDAYGGGGRDDWFLPSTDELSLLYDHFALKGTPAMRRIPYWSSSENSSNFAWYQLFQDGTRFTDENRVGKVDANKNAVRMPRHDGSGFAALRFGLVAVRAFGPRAGVRPETPRPMLTGRECTESGPCAIGDTGPGGGVVFYDAGTRRPWGRWLELAPPETEFVGYPWKPSGFVDRAHPIHRDSRSVPARHKRVLSKSIGAGMSNTKAITATYGAGTYAARLASGLSFGGKSDWFLPSEYELVQAHRFLFTAVPSIGGMSRSFYWSSSEYDYDNAWTVNMKDGQTFDRLKDTVPDDARGVKPIRVRAVRAFGGRVPR